MMGNIKELKTKKELKEGFEVLMELRSLDFTAFLKLKNLIDFWELKNSNF